MTPVPGLNTIYWVTVGEAPAERRRQVAHRARRVTTIKLADITTNPPTFTDLIQNGTGSGMIGPDGCLYVSGLDTISTSSRPPPAAAASR